MQSPELPYEAAQGMVLSVMWSFVAFNAFKAGVNSLATYLLYKPVSRLFHKEFHLKQDAAQPKPRE